MMLDRKPAVLVELVMPAVVAPIKFRLLRDKKKKNERKKNLRLEFALGRWILQYLCTQNTLDIFLQFDMFTTQTCLIVKGSSVSPLLCLYPQLTFLREPWLVMTTQEAFNLIHTNILCFQRRQKELIHLW